MTQINSTGFVLTRLDERWDQLVQAFKDIFGDNINVDPNSIDGQTIGIFAESINNLDMLAEQVYHSFDPDSALGVALSRLVKLNGITRQAGSFSTVTLLCTGTQGTIVPAGSIVASADGSTSWGTTVDGTIDNTGQVSVAAQASKLGPFSAPIGTLTKIATPVYGWQTVTNPAQATPGTNPETDEELRIRRAISTSTPAVGPLDAIRGALLNLTGVTQAMVYENSTDAVDGNGQAAHSIRAVVLGGADQDILDTIWFKKPAGVNVVGAQAGQVVDTAGFGHTMKFDRPASTNIYIVVNVKKRTGYPANGSDLIKAALVAFGSSNFSIGQTVIQSEFYAPLLSAIAMTGSILSLCIGTAPAPAGTVDVTIAYNAIAAFDVSRITVNES